MQHWAAAFNRVSIASPAHFAICGEPFAKFIRESRVTQSCTDLHRGAFSATGAPANRLMQLMLQISVCD